MAWMKLDDKFHSSRKVHSIPKRHRFQAVGLWAIAGSWVAGEETDGFVPDYMIEQWAPTAATVDALVTAGLWESADGGYRFCAWLEYNPSKAQTRAEREASAARMKASRERRKAESGAESGTSRGRTEDEQTSSRGRTDLEQRPDETHIDLEQTSDSIDTNPESPDAASNTAGQRPTHADVAVQHPHMLHRNTPRVLQRPDPTRPDPTPPPTPSQSPSGDMGGGVPPPPGNLNPDNPRCDHHAHIPPGERGPNCLACARVRQWCEQAPDRAATERARTAAATRAARDACPRCDDAGWLLDTDHTPVEPAIRCNHQPAREAQHA